MPARKKPEPKAKRIGRPSLYSPELARTICDRLALDESLSDICRDPGMPGMTTIYRWREENPVFREMYARARTDQGHTVADGIGDIRRRLLAGEIDAATATAAANIAKWEASRRASRDFGDKLDLSSSDGSMTPKPGLDVSRLSTEALAEIMTVADEADKQG